MSMADELLKLQQLRESGALTDEEFRLAKSRLLHAPSEDAPRQVPTAPDFNILKEVDPAVTRVADKAVNFQGATSVIGIITFLVVASFIAFGACSIIDKSSDDPFDEMCSQQHVICPR